MERLEVEDSNHEQNGLVEQSNPQNRLDKLREKLDPYSPEQIFYFNCGGYMVCLLFLVVLVVINFTSSHNFSDLDGATQGIYSNLGNFPFTDIILASVCPGGFEELQLGQWPGTNNICHSSGSDTFKTEVKAKKCFNNYYESTPAQQFTKWKGSSICVKRVKSIRNDTKYCPSGYTKCYSDLCVSGSLCPITHLEFSDIPFDQTTTTGSVKTDFDSYLNFNRDQQKPPIGVLRVSMGTDSPCLDLNEYPTQIYYPAMKEKPNGCLNYGVFPSYRRIDTDTSVDLLSVQPWSTEVMRLPLLNKTLETQSAYLTYVPRLELKNNVYCKSLDLGGLVHGSSGLDSSSWEITMSLLVLVGLVFILLRYYPMDTEKQKMTALIIGWIATGIVFAFGTMVISGMTSQTRSFLAEVQEMTNKECLLDQNVQKALTDYISINGSITSMLKAWIIGTILNLIWFVVALLTFYLKFM